MADDALAGRAEGVNVIQIAPVPDVVDVSRLGFRKDGASIYRPPGEARYVTAEHLDLEEWLLRQSKAAALQRGHRRARPPPRSTGRRWTLTSRRPRRGLLTSRGRRCRCLVAPAGTGKTFTDGQFAAGLDRPRPAAGWSG